MIRYKIVANKRYEGESQFKEGWAAIEDPAGEWVIYAEVLDELNRLEEMLDHEYKY